MVTAIHKTDAEQKKKTAPEKSRVVGSGCWDLYGCQLLNLSVAAVAIAAAFCAGIVNTSTSSFNSVFPIAVEAIQHIGSIVLGKTPKDKAMFEYGSDGLPLCQGCHCTPGWDEDPTTFVCPDKPAPKWKYDEATIEELHSHEAHNPFRLECNPYQEEDCDTVPSLQRNAWGADAVCGLIYDVPAEEEQHTAADATCPLSNYTIQSFRSKEEAKAANAVITHLGHCGACSTTKDLAAYMTHTDMVAEGRKCTNRVLLSRDWGRQCYESLGFTTPCAMIWAHNSLHTATVCRPSCVRHLFSAANGPEPACKLNDCLHCDEIKSGPNFQLFAGRTRRNSGLRTPIMRECDGFAFMEHVACPLDVIRSGGGD